MSIKEPVISFPKKYHDFRSFKILNQTQISNLLKTCVGNRKRSITRYKLLENISKYSSFNVEEVKLNFTPLVLMVHMKNIGWIYKIDRDEFRRVGY